MGKPTNCFITDLDNRLEVSSFKKDGSTEIKIIGKHPLSMEEQASALADLIENAPSFFSYPPPK